MQYFYRPQSLSSSCYFVTDLKVFRQQRQHRAQLGRVQLIQSNQNCLGSLKIKQDLPSRNTSICNCTSRKQLMTYFCPTTLHTQAKNIPHTVYINRHQKPSFILGDSQICFIDLSFLNQLRSTRVVTRYHNMSFATQATHGRSEWQVLGSQHELCSIGHPRQV